MPLLRRRRTCVSLALYGYTPLGGRAVRPRGRRLPPRGTPWRGSRRLSPSWARAPRPCGRRQLSARPGRAEQRCREVPHHRQRRTRRSDRPHGLPARPRRAAVRPPAELPQVNTLEEKRRASTGVSAPPHGDLILSRRPQPVNPGAARPGQEGHTRQRSPSHSRTSRRGVATGGQPRFWTADESKTNAPTPSGVGAFPMCFGGPWHPASRPGTGFSLVAGTGFEPATFGS